MSDDERLTFSVKMDAPESPTSDESDIGIRRQFKAMKARLQELELMYATRFRHQVPVSISELRTEHQPGMRCGFHLHVLVSMKTPSVQCATCHEELDPMDVLRQFTTEERTFAMCLEHLRQEDVSLRAEVAALKKQKATLRAAVRKAGGTPIESWQVKPDSEG